MTLTGVVAVCSILTLWLWIGLATVADKRTNRRAVQRKAVADRAVNLEDSIAHLERLVSVPIETLIADAERAAIREFHGSAPTMQVTLPPDCNDCEYAELRTLGSSVSLWRLIRKCRQHSLERTPPEPNPHIWGHRLPARRMYPGTH